MRFQNILYDVIGAKAELLAPPSLEQVYLKVMDRGVTDPRTDIHYEVKVRKNRAYGFNICDKCDNLHKDIAAARTPEEKECYIRKLATHHRQVKEDRMELARVARLCKMDDRHVGFMIDAVDKNKFQVPTTERQSKALKRLNRLVQKITGVQWLHDNSVQLFNCLPDVPTGGNLTMTIIAELFKTERVKRATDLYVNFDGASDNICYHVFYGLAYLLLSARQAGWPLNRIHILRFKVQIILSIIQSHIHSYCCCITLVLCLQVGHSYQCYFALVLYLQVGHTHNELDGTFGLLARNIYGKECGGTTARDVLSFSSYEKVCCC